MVRIFFVLPLVFVYVLFPHLIVGHDARRIKLGEVPKGKSSFVEIPNMHSIGTPNSQINKPNFESQAPSTQAKSPGRSQNTQNQNQNRNQGGGKANPMIEKACGATRYKQLCIDNLKADPLSGNADMKSLAFISLNLTKNEANRITGWLDDQLDDPDLSATIQQAFTDCSEQYKDAAAQVEDSMLAFFANAVNDVEIWMSVAIGNSAVCESALDTYKCKEAMGNRNEVFRQQSTNSLDIATNFMNQK